MRTRRILYLGYYLKEMDWRKLFSFSRFAAREVGVNSWILILNAFRSVFRYNISVLEYFQFDFYKISEREKATWAGTGYMYEFQLIMNPRDKRQILDDKTRFFKVYEDFLVHTVADIPTLETSHETISKLLTNPGGKLVFKLAAGKGGKAVDIKSCEDFTAETLLAFMHKSGFDLVEEYVIQHRALQKLSPSAVNTVRIFTQLDENNQVHLLGCRLRISVNSKVDNLAAGNLAAVLDEKTGKVVGEAVYSDITKPSVSVHPITGVEIEGFQVPFWNETIEMVKKAALLFPENHSIGWDIVITEKGPGLIEGNHDWCKLLWQLPAKQGLKHLLEPYLKINSAAANV